MPKKIPKSKKLVLVGFFLNLISDKRERDQKKIRITSVDNKKEDTVTEGNKKKEKAVIIARSFFWYNS